MFTPILPVVTAFTLLAFQTGVPQWADNEKLLSTHEISLEKRHAVSSVNQVFKDNILLNLAYLDGRVKSKDEINWEFLRRPYAFEMRLNPGETFGFHEDGLPPHIITKNTNAHFNGAEGFKSDGYLMGDGVCHLASLINWSAKDAGLLVEAPTKHNFAMIPEVPREYGTSIYYYPGKIAANARQNLYITNNLENQITFRFLYIDNELQLSIFEII